MEMAPAWYRRSRNRCLRRQQNQVVSMYAKTGDLEDAPDIPRFIRDVLYNWW
jgi:hypothetical protein